MVFPESMAKGSSVGFMGVIIMRVITKSYHHQRHCAESSSSLEPLRRVIAQSHCAESFAQSLCAEGHLRGAMLMRGTGEEQCS